MTLKNYTNSVKKFKTDFKIIASYNISSLIPCLDECRKILWKIKITAPVPLSAPHISHVPARC